MSKSSKIDLDEVTVRHYISVVVNKIQVMMQKINDISQRDYASSSPIALSEIIVRLLSRFLDYLKSWDEKVGYQPPTDIIRAVYTVNHIVVAIMPELIEAIETADNDTPVASVVEAFEYIGSQVQYGTKIIIHPTWEYNASSNEIMQYLKKVTSSLGREGSDAIFSGSPQNFVLITYPKIEEPVVLRQALIAHEFGHFIDESILRWSDSMLNQQLFNPNDIEEIISKKSGDGESQSKVIQMIEKMISPWIKEVVSDFLAIAIIGPAYLFAFDEISFSPKYSYPKKLSLSHPPDQLRKAVMGKWISEIYFAPIKGSTAFKRFSGDDISIFEKIVQRVEVISQSDNPQFDSVGRSQQVSENMLTVVYSILKSTIENIALVLEEQNLKTIGKNEWICQTTDITDAIKLQNLLSYGLIPTELYETPSRSPSFAAVMNSGWFHFIGHESDYLYFYEANNKALNPDQITARYLTLQNLIAKAIESLHFKREFNRRKGVSRE